MARKHNTFDYETLVRYMLPTGMLDYFEITMIYEEVTDVKDETGTIIRILHIHLDERDLRDKAWHDLKPNGFTEPRQFNDFPQREHKVLLEFADFLKKMVGHLPGDGPMRGALLPD